MESKKITAILISYKRVDNLKKIVNSLIQSQLVGEIIIFNNNKYLDLNKYIQSLNSETIKVINSNFNFLCVARYSICMLAKYENIFFQDDDLLFSINNLNHLYEKFKEDENRICGYRGRNLISNKYEAKDVFGEVDIILGQAMLFNKKLLSEVYGQILNLTPFDRGDDIAFSLLLKRKHLAIKMDVIDLSTDDNFSLWRIPGHLEKRQAMVNRLAHING